MALSSTISIEDLTPLQIEKLTKLLALPPGSSPTRGWLSNQKKSISYLPAPLLKPKCILLKLSPSPTSKAPLCDYHRALNAHLIRQILLLFSAESNQRLKHLSNSPRLPESVQMLVARLQKLSTAFFPQTSHQDKQFSIPGCEACLLAAIGGNPDVLLDLRAAMLGRKKKRAPEPRLLRLVEGWIEGTGRGEDVMKRCEKLARMVLACRKKLQVERRGERERAARVAECRGEGGEGLLVWTKEVRVEGEETEEDESRGHFARQDYGIYEDDWEKGRQELDSGFYGMGDPTSIGGIVNGLMGGRVSELDEAQHISNHCTHYIESVYSDDSEFPDAPRRTSEELAKEYRRTAGIEEEKSFMARSLERPK